jgi:hypothetical protein
VRQTPSPSRRPPSKRRNFGDGWLELGDTALMTGPCPVLPVSGSHSQATLHFPAMARPTRVWAAGKGLLQSSTSLPNDLDLLQQERRLTTPHIGGRLLRCVVALLESSPQFFLAGRPDQKLVEIPSMPEFGSTGRK